MCQILNLDLLFKAYTYPSNFLRPVIEFCVWGTLPGSALISPSSTKGLYVVTGIKPKLASCKYLTHCILSPAPDFNLDSALTSVLIPLFILFFSFFSFGLHPIMLVKN